MSEAYIVSAVRTPIGRFGGALKDLSPVALGAHVMRAALERAGIGGASLDLYVFGNVLRAGHGQLLPRQAAIQAGIPAEVDGMAIDMVCASGMMSILNATTLVRAGEADLVLAGGMESMSSAGFYLSSRARWGYRLLTGSPEPLEDIMLRDGLTDPLSGEAMGIQAERLARERNVSRREVDEVALVSQQRAAEATAKGYFRDEIAPISYVSRGETRTLEVDEGIRADTTIESLSQLRPAFEPGGVFTAGNSSQISDGAAAVLVAGERVIEAHGLQPIARIVGGAVAAGEPWRYAEAPIPAVRKLLDRLGVDLQEFDLVENNEAFALNSILFGRMMDLPYDRLNVHGGAIALGHPIGASGARIVVTLIHALRRVGGARGLATICHGTGGSASMALELV